MKWKLAWILLLLIFLFRPLESIYQQKDKFFSTGYHKLYEGYKNAYESSQYVKKKNPGIIPDETFEAFAAGAFLKGLNPILIVHDHPPLGRYILSGSIILFDNVHTTIPIALGLSLLGVFLLTQLITKNKFVALIPVGILANESLFLNKLLFTPLPEPIQLPFIIFSFYFFIKAIEGKKDLKWFILTTLTIGCVISIRFFVLGAVIAFAMFVFLLLRKKFDSKCKKFILTLPLTVLVLMASYTKTIIDSGNPLQFLSIQKYILSYHGSKFILPFTFWDLFFFNRWHTWWGNRQILSDPQWSIIWPISYLLSVLGVIYKFIKKITIHDGEKLLLIYVLLLSLMLSTGYTSTRYFLPLIPFLYILATSITFSFIKGKYGKKHKKK
jgi:hypothetical protein